MTWTHYHVGHNMVGYLPESDPWIAEDWESAQRAMIEDLERFADFADDADEHDQAEEASSLAEDLNLDNGPEWGAIVGNESYWITPCDEEGCENDD